MHRNSTRKDESATRAANFLSKASYISTIRASHNGGELHQCCYLSGADAGIRREEIFKRDGYKCRECGRQSFVMLELDHIEGGRKMKRCWHPSNLQTLCFNCHRMKHLRVRFGEHVSRT